MARMVPSTCEDGSISAAERKVFDVLANDLGTRDWTVLHSLGLARRGNKPYGEIDFLVLIPRLGIVCLEVKGGRVSCHDGIWTTTDRFGRSAVLKRSPFMQTREGMFAVQATLRSRLETVDGPNKVSICSGVIFPDVDFTAVSIEWEPWEKIDRTDVMNSLSGAILRLAREEWRKRGGLQELELFDGKLVRRIVQLLRPDFEVIVSAAARIGECEALILRLTQEQFEVLDMMVDNPRCLFEGAAGTGKTVLAMECAKRSVVKSVRTLLVCYNRLLGKWLKSQLRGQIESGLITVGSYNQVARDMVLRSTFKGEYLRKESEYGDRDVYSGLLPFYSQLAFEEAGPQFDFMVLDEAQDLFKPEVLEVLNLGLKDGIRNGRWSIFGDFHRQAIFQGLPGDEAKKLLSKFAPMHAHAKLSQNCRNTKHIAEETSLLSGFDSPPYRLGSVEGVPVEYVYYSDRRDQARLCSDLIRRLLKDGVNKSDIVVLSRLRLNSSGVASLANGRGVRLEDVQNLGLGDNAVGFSTIQGFKGMESPVAVLCDVDRIHDTEPQSLLYVGMSRARDMLFVMLSEDVRDELQTAVLRRLEVAG